MKKSCQFFFFENLSTAIKYTLRINELGNKIYKQQISIQVNFSSTGNIGGNKDFICITITRFQRLSLLFNC